MGFIPRSQSKALSPYLRALTEETRKKI